jgi:hypothetical protein
MPKGEENNMLREVTAMEFANAIRASRQWINTIVPETFPGYKDCNFNREILFGWIYDQNGLVTLENLTIAATACASRLHGLSDGEYVARKAAKVKAAADKVIADKQQQIAALNGETIKIWFEKTCPISILGVNDNFSFVPDGDRVLAFINAKYPKVATLQEPITSAHLCEAVEVLWDSLTKFSLKPEDNLFRNMPVVERKMTKQMRIEAGLEREMPHAHESTKPAVSMQEVAHRASEAFRKAKGLPSREEQAKTELEALSVNGRQGRFDHGTTTEIRAIRVLNTNGTVNWTASLAKAKQACDTYDRSKQRAL